MDFRNRSLGRLLLLGIVGVALYAVAITTLFPTMGSPGMEGNFVAGTSSLMMSLIGMAAASLLIFRGPGRGAYSRDFERAENVIMSRNPTNDESRILENVKGVPGGITQDALRFRTGWPRERLQAALDSLEKAGKVRLEEFGSTRKVFARGSGSPIQED